MKILLIEDDPNKREKIESFVRTEFPAATLISHCSYNSGLNAIIDCGATVVLLDMSLPMFDISPTEDGYNVDPYAGRFILTEMKRMCSKTPVIIITQFDTFGEGSEFKTLSQLEAELMAEFPDDYKGSIFYSPAEENWKAKLSSTLRNYD